MSIRGFVAIWLQIYVRAIHLIDKSIYPSKEINLY